MTQKSPRARAFIERLTVRKRRPEAPVAVPGSGPAVQQIYDELMKESWAPALRSAGLKGSRGRFQLPCDKHWLLLGFQKSSYSTADVLRFTVNLSAIDRGLWVEYAGARPDRAQTPTPIFTYGDWHEHVRIGHLTRLREDHWWRLRRGEDPQATAEQVLVALRELAVPWLVSRSGS